MNDEEARIEQATDYRMLIRLVVAALAALGLVIFIFQNTQEADVQFLWLDGTPPLYLLLLITVALTVILTTMVSWSARRRRRS